jgi:hypothetical protein
MEIIFSISVFAFATLNEKNALLAAASKWLLSNSTNPW